MAASGGVTLRGGSSSAGAGRAAGRRRRPAATGAANDARSVRPALRGHVETLGVRRALVEGQAAAATVVREDRPAAHRTSAPEAPRPMDRRAQTGCVEINQSCQVMLRNCVVLREQTTPSSRRDHRDNVASMALESPRHRADAATEAVASMAFGALNLISTQGTTSSNPFNNAWTGGAGRRPVRSDRT